MFKSNNDDEIDDLISYCMLYALEYYINDVGNKWSTLQASIRRRGGD